MAQVNPPKPLITPEQRAEERADGFQTTVARGRSFFEEYRTAIIAASVGLVALIAGIVGYTMWSAAQDAEAEEALGTILTAYETGDLETALQGDDDRLGLLEIADRYGSGTAAPFFAGDALFQLGRYDEAERYFEMADLGGIFGASAVAGRAAVQEAQGNHAEAADLYERAASAYAEGVGAPGYLLDAGRAHEAAGDLAAARAAYQRVVDDYADAPEAATATVELAGVIAAAEPVGQATGDVEPGPAPDSTATPAASGGPAQLDLQEALQNAVGGE